MDWFDPAKVPPDSRPPISKVKCVLLALLPPLLHMVFQLLGGFMTGTSVANAIIRGMDTSGMTYDEVLQAVNSSPEYLSALMDGALYGGIVSIGLFTFMYKRRKPIFSPERQRSPARLIWFVVLIAVTGNFVLSTGIGAIQTLLGTDLPTSSIEGFVEHLDETDQLIILLYAILIAPIAEELCFRGLAMNRLMAVFPFWKANLIQAAIFGLIHVTPIQAGYAFLFGLLLGWIYHRTGRFDAVILGHIVFNFAPALLALVPNYEILTESPVRMFLLIGLPAGAALCAALRTLHKKLI